MAQYIVTFDVVVDCDWSADPEQLSQQAIDQIVADAKTTISHKDYQPWEILRAED